VQAHKVDGGPSIGCTPASSFSELGSRGASRHDTRERQGQDQGYSLEDTRSVAQRTEDVRGVALVRLDDGTLDVVVDLGLLGAHEARAHCVIASRRRVG